MASARGDGVRANARRHGGLQHDAAPASALRRACLSLPANLWDAKLDSLSLALAPLQRSTESLGVSLVVSSHSSDGSMPASAPFAVQMVACAGLDCLHFGQWTILGCF